MGVLSGAALWFMDSRESVFSKTLQLQVFTRFVDFQGWIVLDG